MSFIATTGSPWQTSIARLLKSKEISLRGDYNIEDQKIIFLENQTVILPELIKDAPKKKSSIQRALLNTTLKKLSFLLDHSSSALDLGGTKAYAEFLGFSKNKYLTANIDNNADIYIDLNSEKFNLSQKFRTIISLNTLLLIRNTEMCLDNIINCLTEDGIVILDFISSSSWYLAPDGTHWHNFNPSQINRLLNDKLEFVIIPIGNIYLQTANYFFKNTSQNRLTRLLRKIAERLLQKPGTPDTAIHYLIVGHKKNDIPH